MFKRVVAGCDGCDEGRDAVALGEAIASATGAGLSIVAAFPTSLLPVPGSTDRRTLRAQAEKALRVDRRALAPDAVTAVIADSSYPRALSHYADRWRAGLLVIGSDRTADLGRSRLSRRGRQLLHEVPFALAVAARGRREQPATLGTIAVGYDGGPEAQAALTLAADLARASGRALLVHAVVDDALPAFTAADWMSSGDWSHAEIWKDARRVAEDEARMAVQALDVKADVTASVGDPGYELRDLSADADLLVIGSRRWGSVSRLVTGGVGETLVADAGCSLLIVPRPTRAAPEPGASQAGLAVS